MKEKLAAIAEIKAEKQKQADRDEETSREVNRSVSTTIPNNTKELSPQNEINEKPVGCVKLSKKDSSDWGNDVSSEDSRDSSKGNKLCKYLMNNGICNR